MKAKEFKESGYNLGDIVWVCDYRFNNEMLKKPIRHVPPTKVMIACATETGKHIYYSSFYFQKLNKKDEPIKSSVIALFDNTGYRFCTGTGLRIFYTEKECIEYYKDVCEGLVQELHNERDRVLKIYSDMEEKLTSNTK